MTITRFICLRRPIRRGACTILIASGICLAVGTASAQVSQPSTAKKDFVLHCADCHGIDGKGKGPATEVIPGFQPANLTLLTKNSGGQFPRQEVYDVIDGRKRMFRSLRSGYRHAAMGSDVPARGPRVQQRS